MARGLGGGQYVSSSSNTNFHTNKYDKEPDCDCSGCSNTLGDIAAGCGCIVVIVLAGLGYLLYKIFS